MRNWTAALASVTAQRRRNTSAPAGAVTVPVIGPGEHGDGNRPDPDSDRWMNRRADAEQQGAGSVTAGGNQPERQHEDRQPDRPATMVGADEPDRVNRTVVGDAAREYDDGRGDRDQQVAADGRKRPSPAR